MTLSIVIPAYNEEQYIAQCLASILAQTELPDEVIVVDNNSTDRTAQIAERFPLVRVVREQNQGIVFARDAGFNAATGDVIGRIDADTVLLPDWAHKVKRAFAHHKTGAVTGPGYFYGLPNKRATQFLHTLFYYKGSKRLLGHEVLWGSNMAMRRSVWDAIKADVCRTNEIHEDIDLAIHIARVAPIVFDKDLVASVAGEPGRYLNMELKDRLLMWPKSIAHQHNLSVQ